MNSLQSPLGEIPSGWVSTRLESISTKIGTGATPTGGREVYLKERTNFALVRSQNVHDSYFDDEGLAYISDDHAIQLRGVWLEPNDILLNITGDGETFSRSCIVPNNVLPACVNQHVSIIRLDPWQCVPGYLLAYLHHPKTKHYINAVNVGGSRRAITKELIEDFIVPLPPLPEQRAIAAILSTWDEAITLTERLIAALQQRKQGLMQRLLTGEVRFSEFEGQAWRKVKLPEILGDSKNAIKVGPFGSQLKKSEMTDKGYKVYGQENVFYNDFDLGDRYISPDKFQALRSCEILPGDFLVTMMGTIGKCAIVPNEIEPGIMDSHLMRLRVNPEEYFLPFLAQVFQSFTVIKQVNQLSVGGIMDGLSSQIMQKLNLPAPSVNEQKKIADLFDHADESAEALLRYRTTLKTQKKGLMQRLLTGQIRVRED